MPRHQIGAGNILMPRHQIGAGNNIQASSLPVLGATFECASECGTFDFGLHLVRAHAQKVHVFCSLRLGNALI